VPLFSAFSSLARSCVIAAGGCNTNCESSCAVPLQALSQRSATLVRITNQPSPRRGSISRAPISNSNSSGTGGSISAVTTGFQDSIPKKMKRLFKGVDQVE